MSVSIYSISAFAQTKPDYSRIDMMLIKGEYKKVVDTCKVILATDTLNSAVYYRSGLAYQNLMSDDKSLECFLKATSISPENNDYQFTVAKSYFNREKNNKAKPILLKLCAADSMNWPYASYLTSIYTQEERYDQSLKIYYRFYRHDYNNYIFTDKIGYAYLKKGDSKVAIDMFQKSLSLNPNNTNAIKNLAYLYAGTVGADTAIVLLNRAIAIDSTDMDLYVRRAAIRYTIFDYENALVDYQKMLATGDSSLLNLKRTGISLAKTNHQKEATKYLLKAYKKEPTDLDVVSALAQNYMLLNEMKKSASYFRELIKLLTPFGTQIGMNYILLGEVLKSDSQYEEAVYAYLKSQETRSDNNVIMIVANLYDEKLNDVPKAIRYYELYLNKVKNSKDKRDTDYIDSVTKRIESLKKQNKK
jgi:tetratricopeptide (TPR) repeat protein